MTKSKTIKGKTPKGFSFEVDADRLDDYELFEEVTEAESNPMLGPSILKKVLGEEQKNRLVDFCRGENGRAKIADVTAEMSAIFKSINELKNS